MKFLTQIYVKWENKISLDKSELRFLYEINGKIQGFGYKKDTRIEEILDTKDENNKKIDLACIFGCNPNQISFNENEALSGDIVYHWCDLDLSSFISLDRNLPEYVGGNLNLRSLVGFEGNFPKHVGGYLRLKSLKSFKGNLPEHVGGYLNLSSLESFCGNFPKYIGGYLALSYLKSFEGNFPEYVGLNLDLRSLTSFQGNLPEYVGGKIMLNTKLSEETKDLFLQKFGEDKVEFN